MARVIVEVEDPLSQKPANIQAPPLMLGTYVRVEIAGKMLRNVISVPETVLHDGQQIWLMSAQQTLEIHKVDPVWIEQGKVYLSKDQLPENARIIASDLSAPVPGMRIRTAASADTTPKS